jgi:hypothetical protein
VSSSIQVSSRPDVVDIDVVVAMGLPDRKTGFENEMKPYNAINELATSYDLWQGSFSGKRLIYFRDA